MKALKANCHVAVVQVTPVMFSEDKCIEKVLNYISECAAHGAELIVFRN